MRRFTLAHATLGVAVLAGWSGLASADEFSARLSGFNEIGPLTSPTGAILSDGTGTLRLDREGASITYTLTFSGLTSPVTQAHLHFGKIHVAGGIMVFLCSNLGNGPAGTQLCPANGGTVTGTITAGNVLAVVAQNVTAGDFDALTDALGSNTVYVNVHTVKFPGGEIRGQTRGRDRDDE